MDYHTQWCLTCNTRVHHQGLYCSVTCLEADMNSSSASSSTSSTSTNSITDSPSTFNTPSPRMQPLPSPFWSAHSTTTATRTSYFLPSPTLKLDSSPYLMHDQQQQQQPVQQPNATISSSSSSTTAPQLQLPDSPKMSRNRTNPTTTTSIYNTTTLPRIGPPTPFLFPASNSYQDATAHSRWLPVTAAALPPTFELELKGRKHLKQVQDRKKLRSVLYSPTEAFEGVNAGAGGSPLLAGAGGEEETEVRKAGGRNGKTADVVVHGLGVLVVGEQRLQQQQQQQQQTTRNRGPSFSNPWNQVMSPGLSSTSSESSASAGYFGMQASTTPTLKNTVTVGEPKSVNASAKMYPTPPDPRHEDDPTTTTQAATAPTSPAQQHQQSHQSAAAFFCLGGNENQYGGFGKLAATNGIGLGLFDSGMVGSPSI